MASITVIYSTIKAELDISHDGIDLREPIPEFRTAFAMTNQYFVPQITARQMNTRFIRTFDSYEYNTYIDEVVSGENTPLIELKLNEWTEVQPRANKRTPASFNADSLRSIGYVQ